MSELWGVAPGWFGTISGEESVAELGLVLPRWKLGEPLEGFDPNERDGEWREIVFMPHTAEWFTLDSAETWHWVPAYLTLPEALEAERENNDPGRSK